MKKILLIVMCVSLPVSAYCQTANLEVMNEGSLYGDSLIRNGEVRLTYEYTRVDSLSNYASRQDSDYLASIPEGNYGVIHNRQLTDVVLKFDGIRMVCNETCRAKLPSGRWYDQDWTWAYNGEKLELLRLDGLGAKGLILPFGSVRTANVIPRHRYDPRYYGFSIMGTPVSTFFDGFIDGKAVAEISIQNNQTVDGISCNVVTGRIIETDEKLTLWLVPQYMYRPKQIQIDSDETQTLVTTDFINYASDIWFPQRIEKKVYYYSDSGEKVLYTIETLEVAQDIKLNTESVSDAYEVDFPSGMKVYDFRTGMDFETP